MKCTNCGFVTNCNFCPMCGTKLITEEIDNNGTSGSVLDDITEFSKINSNEIGIFEAEKKDIENNKKKRSGKRGVFAVVSAAVFAVILGGISCAVYSAVTHNESYFDTVDLVNYSGLTNQGYHALEFWQETQYYSDANDAHTTNISLNEEVELITGVTLKVVSAKADDSYEKGSQGNTKWTVTYEITNNSDYNFKTSTFEIYLSDMSSEESYEWVSSNYEFSDDDYYSMIIKAGEKQTFKDSFSVSNNHGKMNLNLYFYSIDCGNQSTNYRDLNLEI